MKDYHRRDVLSDETSYASTDDYSSHRTDALSPPHSDDFVGHHTPIYSSEEEEEEDGQSPNIPSDEKRLIRRTVTLYKRRWLTLFIFSLNTTLNGALFMSLNPINNIAAMHYDVNPVHIEWLSNMYMLAYIFVALPSAYCMAKWGVKPIIIIASGFDFVAGLLHFAGYGRTRFWMILIGQLFAAIAYGMILQIPGKLSALWFPKHEIATATSIGVFMNIFGVAVGFLQPTSMVLHSPDGDMVESQIRTFFLSQLICCSIVFFLTVFLYQEKPPTPPVLRENIEVDNFYDSLKLLWQNKYFIVLSQTYGIYFGLFVTFSVLVNPLITSKYPVGYETQLGWMGFWSDMAAIISCLIIGILLDSFYVHQLVAIFLNGTSLVVWLAFFLALTITDSFTALYVLFVLLGVFGIPYFASGIDQCAEMTYPVSEGTSSAVILIIGNLYGFVFIFVLGAAVEIGYVQVAGYTMVVLYFISTILALFAKTELKRVDAEEQATTYAGE